MDYRREIDGLRALSVLAVILFHADFTLFSGGFVGVDIFFVISGYLITSIIISEKKNNSFSLLNFYERRVRRILPALFFVLFCCLPLAWHLLGPTDMKSFSQSLIAVSGFASNFLFYSSTGYFDTAAEWKPLLHTWSLAVEEQYYLFFPLLLMFTWRLGSRLIIVLLAVITMASLTAAQWYSTHNPAAGFYLLPARGWELLIGSFTAFYLTNNNHRCQHFLANQIGSTLGILLIVYSIFIFDKKIPFPSLYTLVPTIGAMLIIVFATPQTLVGKLLGYRLFVSIGLISYSAYLWHWPLFVFARYESIPESPNKLLMGSLAALSIVLGYLSWKCIEIPFRHKQKIHRNKLFLSGAMCSFFILVFGITGHLNKGYSSRIPNYSATPEPEFPSKLNGWCMYVPDYQADSPIGAKGAECWLGNKLSEKKAILLGDSFAAHYDPFWDIVGQKTQLNINSVTTNYCVPTRNEDWTGGEQMLAKEQCFYDRRYFSENISKYDIAILGGNWMDYSARNNMDSVLDIVDFAAANTKLVVLMAAPKAFDVNPVEAYNKSLLEKTVFDITQITSARDAELIRANTILEETSKKYKNVLYIRRDSLFNIDGVSSDVSMDNIPFTYDGGHISIYGSKSAASAFLESQQYKDLIMMLQLTNSSHI